MAKIKHAERLKGGDNSVRLSTEIGKKIMFKPGIKIVTTVADNVKKDQRMLFILELLVIGILGPSPILYYM